MQKKQICTYLTSWMGLNFRKNTEGLPCIQLRSFAFLLSALNRNSDQVIRLGLKGLFLFVVYSKRKTNNIKVYKISTPPK